ncbi:hypothetical protein J2T56_002462 [Natronobacillus azotifigens]
MLNRVLTIELRNDKALHTPRNLLKLFYTFIFPNLTAVQFAYMILRIPRIEKEK